MTTPTQDIFTRVEALPAQTADGEHATDVLLRWDAPTLGTRVVQVYVDGTLHDVADNAEPSELWLTLDRRCPHRVELLAVDAAHAWRDLSALLQTWSPQPRSAAVLGVLRDEALPIDTVLSVSVGDEEAVAAPLWPGDVPRSGFGGLFGMGAFGFDSAAGPGLGFGALGEGRLGNDGNAWRWGSSDLPPGEFDLSLEAHNANGFGVAPAIESTQAIDHPPAPPRGLAITSDFVLTWSTDDA